MILKNIYISTLFVFASASYANAESQISDNGSTVLNPYLFECQDFNRMRLANHESEDPFKHLGKPKSLLQAVDTYLAADWRIGLSLIEGGAFISW